jgi:hypothetical protein
MRIQNEKSPGPITIVMACGISAILLPLIIPVSDGAAEPRGSNGPPYVKERIPDFEVIEGCVNGSARAFDLFQVFGDPGMPPNGDDNLTFTLDNTSFPAFLYDACIFIGVAPVFTGNATHLCSIIITATDRGGMTCSLTVNITVISPNHPPEFFLDVIVAFEDAVNFISVRNIVRDEDGDQLTLTYLGGATENLSVEVMQNGTVMLTPLKDYYSGSEILRFKASDHLGASDYAELRVDLKNVNDAPFFIPGSAAPDPLGNITVAEGGNLTFSVGASDIDNTPRQLLYSWYLDGTLVAAKRDNATYLWRINYTMSGRRNITVRISDGVAQIETSWLVNVTNTNQRPVLLEVWPQNNTEVDAGKRINFCATAHDPDGDTLTFTWRHSDGTLLKQSQGVRTSTFSKVLASGKQHDVVLEVSDGNGGVNRTYLYIRVRSPNDHYDPPDWAPLACASGALAALFGLLSVAIIFLRENYLG